MRVFTILLVLLCSACVVQSPPPYPPVAAAPTVSPQAVAPQPACREFDTPVTINGQEQQAHGMACLQADGTWRIEQSVVGQEPQTYVIPPQVYQPYYPPGYWAERWYYGPPLFFSGVFIGGGWGYHHGHSGWHGAWRGRH